MSTPLLTIKSHTYCRYGILIDSNLLKTEAGCGHLLQSGGNRVCLKKIDFVKTKDRKYLMYYLFPYDHIY